MGVVLHILQFLRRRRTRRAIITAGLALVALASAGIMMAAAMARAAPSWWRSIRREDPVLVSLARRVENSVMNEAAANRPTRQASGVWQSDQWQIRLSADEASAWLSIRLPMWLANQKDEFRWPRNLEDVQVEFQDGALTVGARVDGKREPAPTEGSATDATGGRVLTATVAPRFDGQGRLYLPAERVNVGRLAIPASWVLDRSGGGAATRYIPESIRTLPETTALVRAFEGDQAILESPVIKLGDGRRVRVLSLSLDRGMLEITCRTERPG